MAFTPEQVSAMIAEAVAKALVEVAANRPSGNSDQLRKAFERLDRFEGGAKTDNWKEWYYQFSVAASAHNIKHGTLLELVEKMEHDVTITEDIDLELGEAESEWMHKTKAEIFNVLIQLTTGEANLLVRNVQDRNGYVAWKRLFDRYNPRTPASLTASWREVIRPKKMKDMREATKAIDTWEAKVALLRREHDEEPTVGLKASLLLEMLPDNVQLAVAQGMSSKKLDYDTLKAKIKQMANVQIDYATPKPMDIGDLRTGDADEEEHEWVDVIGVQKGKGKGGPAYGSCWTCGGPRFSRDCPKGGGKKGGGKGGDKGKGKGKSVGPMFGACWTCGGNHFSKDCPQNTKGSGKGKGKTMKCFTCGGVGHRADQCPTSLGEVYQECEDDEGEVQWVSEDWGVFGVAECSGCRLSARHMASASECADCLPSACHVVSAGRAGRWRRGDARTMPAKIGNRFAVLAEEDEDDEKEIQIQEVAEPKRWKRVGKGEVVVDSGAAESVCPWDWAPEFPTKEVPWDQKRKFVNANGGRMQHYGEKKVYCKFGGCSGAVEMNFQVSDAQHPLASVARITEKGSIVQFGPKEEDNYIFNPKTEEKIMMKRRGRRYTMEGDFLRRLGPFAGQA